MSPEEQCSARVWNSMSSFPCQKKPKIQRNGKWYCTIHNPEYVARKAKERAEKYTKEYEERKLKWAGGATLRQIEEAAPVMLEALKDIKDWFIKCDALGPETSQIIIARCSRVIVQAEGKE